MTPPASQARWNTARRELSVAAGLVIALTGGAWILLGAATAGIVALICVVVALIVMRTLVPPPVAPPAPADPAYDAPTLSFSGYWRTQFELNAAHQVAERLGPEHPAQTAEPACRPAGRTARHQPDRRTRGRQGGAHRCQSQNRPVVLDRPAASNSRRRQLTAGHPAKDARRPDSTTGAVVTDQSLTPEATAQRCAAVLDELERAIIGQRRALELVLTGILASSHILLEDLPGLGKTLTARSFARVLGLDFARIQFTPDLLPSDVVGAPLYDQRNGEMVFRPGPVFTQLLLADEINRTPPKTQAALLEAMGEAQVSVDGQTRALPTPFIVLATANPIEYEGTYDLPEAQLDRFGMRLRFGYLHSDDEVAMLQRRIDRAAAEVTLTPVSSPAELLAMRRSLELVEVTPDLLHYVVALIGATRAHPQIQVGASPRGGLFILQLARAHAVLRGRDYVVPDDVKAVGVPALGHRITLRPELWARKVSPDDVITRVLAGVPVPRTDPVAPVSG